MQQWFEDDYSYTNTLPVEKTHKELKVLKEPKMPILKTFTVEAETTDGQYVCVSGNCPTLGNWEVNEALVLTKTDVTHIRNNKRYHVWSGLVHLPPDNEILFRYFVAYIIGPENESVKQKHIFVHSLESDCEPRNVQFIRKNQISNCDGTSQCDIYGMSLSGKQQISKGFLTTECAIQFKLFNTPIKFWNTKIQNKIDKVSIKMTPIRLSKLSGDSGDISSNNYSCLFDDSSSTSDDVQNHFGWPYVECMDIPGDYNFKLQNQFGTIIKENAFHLFQTKIVNFGYFGYLFDVYLHKDSLNEPPYHVGFTHILSSNMKYSDGVIMCPITSVRHKSIGELKIEYLIIKPTKDIYSNLEKVPVWENPYVPLDIGHRGSGSSFTQLVANCSHIRENTLASLKEAANKGADFVEFDVQLSKDFVPIIYHDFHVSLATKSKTDILAENVEMIKIPLKDFSSEQLQNLKIYHVKEPYTLSKTHFLNDERSDYQPFPKLEKAFTHVDINVGFNVELKWTMKLQDGTFELDNPFDMNFFVDTILETVFKFGGSRSIVFSCFHPDICTMLKMKQNRYPILFLTQGVTERYPPYHDPRCHTIQTAVNHSRSHDLLGVNVHSEDLLRDSSQINIVKDAGLALFCWGNDNNCKDVVKKFKKLGVNAVIYDKLDKNELSKKRKSYPIENSEVFIANEYCDQTGILLSKDQSLQEDLHLRENNDQIGDNNRYFMDVGKATFQTQCSSTDSLWNEEKDSKSPSRKQKYECDDHTLETNVELNNYKKTKADD